MKTAHIDLQLFLYMRDCHDMTIALAGERGIWGFIKTLGIKYWIMECWSERKLFTVEDYIKYLVGEYEWAFQKYSKLVIDEENANK